MGNLFHRPQTHIRRTEYVDNTLLNPIVWDHILLAGSPPKHVSSIDADVVLAELSTLGKTGWLMNNANDAIQVEWIPPYWHDFTKQIDVRVRYSTASADAADTLTWNVLYRILPGNKTAAYADPTTALDQTLPQETVGSIPAYAPRFTSFGVINAGKHTYGSSILFKVVLQAKAAGLTEDIFFLGLQIQASATKRGAVNFAL